MGRPIYVSEREWDAAHPELYCAGELVSYIADESSQRCRVCGWVGWPVHDTERGTGVITRIYPHLRRTGPAEVSDGRAGEGDSRG